MRHVLVFGTLLLASASAQASETITYTYDALGRLVKVARTGTVNQGANACYTYDPANNRTNTTSAPNADCTPGSGGQGGGGGNQPPVANFDNGGTMSCGNEKIINVVANDTDPEGNYPLSVVSVSGAGTAVVSSTSIRIISSTSGTKGFTYVVKDSLNAQANGSGSIVVTAPCQ